MSPAAPLSPDNVRDRLPALEQELASRGTLHVAPVANDVYSATAMLSSGNESGYQHAWLRDNVMIAHAQCGRGAVDAALRTARALGTFLRSQIPRIEAIIRNPALKHRVTERPRVRFDPARLSEIDENWANAQNDALGLTLWLRALLANRHGCSLAADEVETYRILVRYLGSIEFWCDADNGMWEETAKVNASSIGAVLAGLLEWEQLARAIGVAAPNEPLDAWIEQGRAALAGTLPFESPPARLVDAATLFLVYPLDVVSRLFPGRPLEGRRLESQVVTAVRARLGGHLGIARYVGDSYYCQDYDAYFSAAEQTANFSESIAFRDALLKPGFEAQWCLFDPICSVIFGRRYADEPSRRDLLHTQLWHFNRALAQLTTEWQCPELYFYKEGRWVDNAHSPLGWTQANLMAAVEALKISVARL